MPENQASKIHNFFQAPNVIGNASFSIAGVTRNVW
jgi:hypothetical protein